MLRTRSLWVQGYTGFDVPDAECLIEFPVGTGIYLIYRARGHVQHGVPCRYRDIPGFYQAESVMRMSSL